MPVSSQHRFRMVGSGGQGLLAGRYLCTGYTQPMPMPDASLSDHLSSINITAHHSHSSFAERFTKACERRIPHYRTNLYF